MTKRNRRKGLPPSFEFFMEAIQWLDKLKNISATIRFLDDGEHYIPLVKSANNAQWSYLQSANKTRRAFVIADILFGLKKT